MLDPSQDTDVVEDDFNKPVESIMRCEDFKSNFARKLSNRYISWTPGAKSTDSTLKLCQTDKQKPNINVPERIERCSQLSASIIQQNGEVVKPPDKTFKNDIHNTEVNALNMEVDTLRWQLAQTETNRQMHIALLKQIVTFLSRVKEHIECQNTDLEPEEREFSKIVQKSTNLDLPRSKSVFHVDKNVDYTINPTKKICTKKISKSINNVNGLKDCSNSWGHPRVPLISENEIAKKLTQEMSRLITLANTVLSTKLPDLTCSVSVNGNEHYLKLIEEIKIVETLQDTKFTLNNNTNGKSETETSSLKYNSLSFTDFSKDTILEVFQARIPNTKAQSKNVVRNDSISKKENLMSQRQYSSPEEKINNIDKKTEFNPVLNFIEDESGFSSMNSFQEIGIPIISIIPPSPNKDMAYMDEFSEVNEAEKWKTDSIEFDKQSVKVFWV